MAEWLRNHERHDEANELFGSAVAMLGEPITTQSATVIVCVHLCTEERLSEITDSGLRDNLLNLYSGGIQPTLEDVRNRAQRTPVESWRPTWDEWCEMSLAHYRPLQWKGAETEAQTAIQVAREKEEWLRKMAPFLLLAGEHDAYREICEQLLTKVDDLHGNALIYALQICLLCPQDERNAATILQAAQRAAEETSNRHLLHVAYYRSGQFDKAIEGLTEDLNAIIHGPPLVQLHLAIANQLSGDTEAAKEWLAKAKAARDTLWQPADKLHFEVLCKEAETAK
ncbi:MAG: hypothetical protein KDA87_25060 [Planctomycetales bacterium]|nr:hypothetical protein [Planctomycetales bacterium]